MKMRALFYDAATGRVVGSLDYDEADGLPEASAGQAVLSIDRPTFEDLHPTPEQLAGGVVPAQDPGNPDWVIDGAAVPSAAYPAAPLTLAGLRVTLGLGHVWGERHAEATAEDSLTFAAPAADQGIALDVVQDEAGLVQLQPYAWDPATETKGALPEGLTLIQADVLRGILPAGASSLNQLEEE
jgi:hypothetical protein